MKAELTISALKDMVRDLHALPRALTLKAQIVIDRNAAETATTLRGAYTNKGAEALAAGIVVRYKQQRTYAAATIVSQNPLSWIYEHGTMVRHVKGLLPGRGKNWGLSRGKMPAANIFVPEVLRARQRVNAQVLDMLQAEGLKVSGG